MADRVEMSFKNKEEKMWFTIMIPVVVMAFFAIFSLHPVAKYLPVFLVLGGYATYYTWRFRYRRKQKSNAGN